MLILQILLLKLLLFILKIFLEKMGWVLICSLEENAYPQLIKDFYTKMVITPPSDSLSCLIKNVQVTVNKALI